MSSHMEGFDKEKRDRLFADEQLVRLAIAAAHESGPYDVPVGAVIVDPEGYELARAGNHRESDGDPSAHAEVIALRAASQRLGDGWRLVGCTLAVTVEPCTMCAGAIGLARIAKVVFGAWEPKTGAVGSMWDVLRDPRVTHRPEVRGGVLAEECTSLMKEFFVSQRDHLA